MHLARIKRSDLPDAKRVIATVVVEYYFDGRYTPDELLARYEKSGYLVDLDRLDEAYDGHRGLLLGAYDGDRLVGTGGARSVDEDTGELVRLWLLPEFRRRGIGRQMVESLVQFSRNAGWKRLRLDTSLRCKEAIALFRSFGFREIAPYKASIGDCFMELSLVPAPSGLALPSR